MVTRRASKELQTKTRYLPAPGQHGHLPILQTFGGDIWAGRPAAPGQHTGSSGRLPSQLPEGGGPAARGAGQGGHGATGTMEVVFVSSSLNDTSYHSEKFYTAPDLVQAVSEGENNRLP